MTVKVQSFCHCPKYVSALVCLAGDPEGTVSPHVGFMDGDLRRVSYCRVPSCRVCNGRGVGAISQNP